MTMDEAIAIRTRQVQGFPVLALELQEALACIVLATPRTGRPHKLRLPRLSEVERMRQNAILLYRIGMELGRIEVRKAA